MKEIKINVEGMVCRGCEARVVNSVSTLEGVEEVIANHNDGTVLVKANETVNIDEIKERIEDLGFEVKED